MEDMRLVGWFVHAENRSQFVMFVWYVFRCLLYINRFLFCFLDQHLSSTRMF